jgi:hypothetical protein
MTISLHTNDGTQDAPKLKVFLNLDNLADLRPNTIWSGATGAGALDNLAADGFEGVQFTTGFPWFEGASMPFCGLDRINEPQEADAIAAPHADRGELCLTVHAGWGTEDDYDVFKLVEAILKAGEKYKLPIFIETHRATITQDMWRTVQITKKFPEVRFNGDFSHYYCGQEMVYGGLKMKMDFMAPIFDRVAFMHGRIAAAGFMQMPVDDAESRPAAATALIDYFADFRKIWTRALQGFLKIAGPGDYLIFAPEILAATHCYARTLPGPDGLPVEESDRYAQALLYKEVIKNCWAEALVAARG